MSAADAACAREPIHVPGFVQPHGALLAATPGRDLCIVAASANTAGILHAALGTGQVLGAALRSVLGDGFAGEVRQRFEAGALRGEAPWQSTQPLQDGRALDVAVHTHAGLIIVEMEPVAADEGPSALDATRQLQEIVADLRSTTGDLQALAAVAARGIQRVTGYERVIVYRFDQDWNGQAIAEHKVPGWAQSLNGLHFPASDIPAQARALYRRSLIRWVPDRDYEPVPLQALPGGPERIDLSFARLRSLSPVHLQYHRNMGVNGSMSLSVLHDDELWGLIVLHHRQPHWPRGGQRAAASALTDAFALRIGPARYAAVRQARRRDEATRDALLAQMAQSEQIVAALTSGPVTALDLFAATGAALLVQGSVSLLGNTPPAEAVRLLCDWIRTTVPTRLFQTDRLPHAFPDWSPHAAIASGVLAIFLEADRSDVLLWFRPEEPRQVSWGGDPRKDAGAAIVLPRESFERWVEVRHGYSVPWEEWELDVAEGLRHAITDVMVRTLRQIADLNERLRQSQKMEAVGQLTGGIAHDFNNLLTGIIGSLERIGTRVAQGRVGELDRYIQAATASANRAATLTHRLLTFSRRQALDPKPIDITRLILSMEDLIRRTMGPAIQVQMAMAPGLWLSLCDANQLENALLNLAINARDAMGAGGHLTIEAANVRLDDAYAAKHLDVAAGQYVALSVTDTGTGMPPDIVARVFEPFFTTKPLGQGTGLGLSMVYGFAMQSKGYARIYSEVGMGTSVRLYLPRYAGPEVDEEAAAERNSDAHPADHAILVVDDEPVVRMLIGDEMRELGYTVIEVGTAADALTILRSDVHIDLLLTDIGLADGLNGRELARQARLMRPNLPTLLITGYAENAAIGETMLEPNMQLLSKPFALDVLAARIRSML